MLQATCCGTVLHRCNAVLWAHPQVLSPLPPHQQHASCCIKPSLGGSESALAACILCRGDQLRYKPKGVQYNLLGALHWTRSVGLSCAKCKRAACSDHAAAAVCSPAGSSLRQIRQMSRKGCHPAPRRLRTTAAAGLPLTGQTPAGSGVWGTRSGISRGGP